MGVTYWGFRSMIGFGGLAAMAALVARWLTRSGTVPAARWLMRLAVFGIMVPFRANASGWIFTEMGRQPFVVAPNPDPSGIDQVFMFTAAAVSPGVSAVERPVLPRCSRRLRGLLVVETELIVKFIRAGVSLAMPELAHVPEDEKEKATPKGGGPGKPGGRCPRLRLLSPHFLGKQRILSLELLPTFWFILIAALWTGYLFLEGFDLGVGMQMKRFTHNETNAGCSSTPLARSGTAMRSG